jgi:hypothetical protein
MIDLVATLLLEALEKLDLGKTALEEGRWSDSIYHHYAGLINAAKALLLSDGTSTNTHWYVVTAVVIHRRWPATQVEPRGRTSRLHNDLFGPDETATGSPDFDRKFRIRTAGPDAIRLWFPLPLITAHLAGRVPTAWNVRGTELLHWQPGRLNPGDIPDHTSTALLLAELLDG